MSLRLRLLLSLLAVLGLLTGPAVYAALQVNTLRDIVLELRGEAAQSALAVGRLEAALVHLDRSQRVFVATLDPEAAARMHAGLREAAGAVATLRTAGYGDVVGGSGLKLEPLRASTQRIEELVTSGRVADATSYLMTDATPLIERARAAIPDIAATIDLRASERVPVAQRSAIAASTATTAAVLVGFVLAIALALMSARVLTVPLDRLRRAMTRVADGAFQTPADLPYEQNDEVGELSRSFRTMTRRLAELDRLKAEFVGTVSHDLKTPVTVITGYAELMQEELRDVLSRRQDELLRSLAEQTRSLQRRIDQVVEISRIEAGRLQLGLEDVHVRHFAAELRREYAPAARARMLRLDLVVTRDAPGTIVADPDVLRRDVLTNLMSSAFEYSPPGGTVNVQFRGDDERLILEISDEGPGLREEEIEYAFGPYYQARMSNGRNSTLGLAIARAGVENHGGRIDVQSRVGRGTRFRITLPIRSVASAFVEPEPPVPARPALVVSRG